MQWHGRISKALVRVKETLYKKAQVALICINSRITTEKESVISWGWRREKIDGKGVKCFSEAIEILCISLWYWLHGLLYIKCVYFNVSKLYLNIANQKQKAECRIRLRRPFWNIKLKFEKCVMVAKVSHHLNRAKMQYNKCQHFTLRSTWKIPHLLNR